MIIITRIPTTVLFLVLVVASTLTCGAMKPKTSIQTARELASYTLMSSLSALTLTGLAYKSEASVVADYTAEMRNEMRDNYVYEEPSDFLLYLDNVVETKKGGDFEGVVAAMDKFATVFPMYALSPAKVKFLQSEVTKAKPSRILEIGSFFGYSAIHITKALGPHSHLTCIEGNEQNAKVAQAVLNKAFGAGSEVLSRVKIITSLSTPVLSQGSLQDVTGSDSALLDFVFLDHDKSFLLPDLKKLESRGWLSDQCIAVADNVDFPGAPDYLEYVNAPGSPKLSDGFVGHWTTTLHPFLFERVGFETGFKPKDDAMSLSRRSSE